MKCPFSHFFLHYDLSVAAYLTWKTLRGFPIPHHSSTLLLFSSTHFRGEEERRAAVCQGACEPWTMRSGQCVPNSGTGRFVHELGRVKRCLHLDREFAFTFSPPWLCDSSPSCGQVEFGKEGSQEKRNGYKTGAEWEGTEEGGMKVG